MAFRFDNFRKCGDIEVSVGHIVRDASGSVEDDAKSFGLETVDAGWLA